MAYDSTWSASLGSYPINTKNFPKGEESLKAVVEKCHAAGLKVGLHMLTSFVGKNDPLVTPKPDPRLLKDGEAALAADVDVAAVELRAAGPLDGFPREGAFYGDARQGMDLAIDDEIIHYADIAGPRGHAFLRCTRGFARTRPVPHKAGPPSITSASDTAATSSICGPRSRISWPIASLASSTAAVST